MPASYERRLRSRQDRQRLDGKPPLEHLAYCAQTLLRLAEPQQVRDRFVPRHRSVGFLARNGFLRRRLGRWIITDKGKDAISALKLFQYGTADEFTMAWSRDRVSVLRTVMEVFPRA